MSLDKALLAAHESRDAAALVRLYQRAGAMMERRRNVDAACFFLTQAYVFALERADPDAAALRRKLVAMGRET